MELFLRRRAGAILVVLCIVSFGLMLATSLRDSTTVDELAHIPSGYAYDHYLDYRLNPEHPPLLKALAALPLLFLNLQFPTTNSFWTSSVNGEWGVGGAFLFGGKNDANAILETARLMPILITIGLILLTYFWARKLFGTTWALVPATMMSLSPIFIAQGHLVTTDVAAAFGTMIGLWSFVEYMEAPSVTRFFIAAIAFGIAILMKDSTVLLIPVFAIALIVRLIAAAAYDPERRSGPRFLRYLGMFFGITLVGMVLVVYPVYALFTAHYPIARQVSDTVSLIGPLADPSCNISQWTACLARVDVWGASHYLTRPFAEYLLGLIMVYERVTGTNVTYFLGQVSDQGSPLYFPIVYALKETIPALIILVVGFAFGLGRFFRALFQKSTSFLRYVLDYFPEFTMIIFIVIYWAVSIKSPLNIGIRHLLPTIPLMYILATGAIARGTKIRKNAIFVAIMLVWLAGETAFAYPYYLSYFNEFGGGIWNGYHYVTDSNYDWGQDMFALQDFMNQHPEINKMAIDFFGGSNPQYYLGDKYVAWQSSMGDPSSQGIHWIAISVNNLQNSIQPTAPGYHRDPNASYGWLLAKHPKSAGMGDVPPPDYRGGTTIFIYKI